MTRVTVEDCTAGLDQTNPPYGASSGWRVVLPGISGLCTSSVAHELPGGFRLRAWGKRPMQASVSCLREADCAVRSFQST